MAVLISEPAKVTVVPLSELGLPAGLTLAAPPSAGLDAGQPEILLRNGVLSIATPGDSGRDQGFKVMLEGGTSVKAVLEVTVKTARPIQILNTAESDEAGNVGSDAPPLTANGLGAGNALGGSPLVIGVQGAPQFSSKASRFLIDTVGGDAKTFDVSNLFAYDAGSNTFTATARDLQDFLATLPNGDLSFTANLVSGDFEFAEVYSFEFAKAAATLGGQLVGANGQALSGAEIDKLSVALVGFSSAIRRVAPVDTSGKFAFEGLVPDTYNLIVTDLQQPNMFGGFVAIFPGSTNATASITYSPSVAGMLASASSLRIDAPGKGSAMGAALVGSRVKQDGARPVPSRGGRTPAANAALAPDTKGCPVKAGDDTFFTVEAAAQGVDQLCAVAFTAPPGTAEVSLEVTVATEEFPEFTTQQSEFNDAWGYSLSASNTSSPASLMKSGRVNDTHVTTGSISERSCLRARRDQSGQPVTDSPITITGMLRSQNVGDSILPTHITVKISNKCGLVVRSGELRSPNSTVNPVIAPRVVSPTDGNRQGRFLSIPSATTQAPEIDLPLVIEYLPADATISELKLAVIRNGNILGETANLLGGSVTATNGKIDIKKLVLDFGQSFPRDGGKIGLSAQIKGKIEGQDAESPRGEVNIAFAGQNNFTPLYLAEDSIPGADRRYGQSVLERGDDNWALASSIDWLSSVRFRFNDISAQHVAQTAAGKSILKHAGHSDGSQIDLRYQDPQGMFADGGIEAVNLALVDTALAESRQAGTATARQSHLASWIRLNRAAIGAAASSARRIYVADGRLGKALILGLYSDDTDILDLPAAAGQTAKPIGAWTDRPKVVLTEQMHLDHWHIALQ